MGWNITNVGEARAAVDSLKRAGVDFVKVYTSLPRDAFFSVVEEANRQGLPVAGHIPTGVSAAEASAAGQVSFEHNGMWVYDGCVADAATRINNALSRWTREGFAAWYAERRAFHASRDAAACTAAYRAFRTNGTWMVPTIVNELKDGRAIGREAFAHLDSASALACENTVRMIEAVPHTIRTGFYSDFAQEIGELHRAHLPLLAGTDLGNPCLAPGFSLHDELSELVAAGLSNAEALAAATVGPARFLRASDSLGSVALGQVADLVLLEADPLLDIRHTKRIRAVVLSGKLFTRPELDAFLAETRRP
jgi:imidazolonepropionase-like amidohydrolase